MHIAFYLSNWRETPMATVTVRFGQVMAMTFVILQMKKVNLPSGLLINR